MHSIHFFREVREYEARCVVRLLNNRGRILDVGAGAGWQSLVFKNNDFDTFAIDLVNSNYNNHMKYPIIQYDGSTLPFADHSFDIVFSSNVLEHITDISGFLIEIRRVCKPDGKFVHVLPSSGWRFWTNITYYLEGLKIILAKQNNSATWLSEKFLFSKEMNIFGKLFHAAIPSRHGEFGNFITEIFYFSRIRWLREFKQAGFKVENYNQNGLFYTGFGFLGPVLNLQSRHRLSKLLGSACHIFILSNKF